MEQYEIRERYEEDDEIDLVDLLKTIIKERKIVLVTTIVVTVLAFGLALYKKSLPKKYTAVITLNNQLGSIPLYQNELEDSIIKYIQGTKLLSSELKEKENKESKYNEYSDLKSLFNQKEGYKFIDVTDEKEIKDVENKLAAVISELNNGINKIVAENVDRRLEESFESLETLKEKATVMDKDINLLIEKNRDVLKENLSENIMYLEPVLYSEFNETTKLLTEKYSEVEKLSFLKKMSDNKGYVLNIKEVEFNKSKIGGAVLIILGMIFGLGFGMFIAIVKEPIKNILKEVREENR